MKIILAKYEDSEESGIHELPDWYTWYCDLFVPADNCMYCWFGRGAAFHAVAGAVICGLLIALLSGLITAP